MKRFCLAVVVLGLLPLAGGQAAAGPVLDFAGGTAFSTTEETIGWEFTVTASITISALGLFDVGHDGLAASHQLGLWSCGNVTCNTGTLLTSATITTANSTPVASASSEGDWRFTPIGSLTLNPGDYVVGATFVVDDPDQVELLTNGPSTIAGVTFDVGRGVPGAGLNFPSLDLASDANPGIFGPNLFVGPLAVGAPEPSALLLLGTGLAGLVGVAWRRAKGQ